MRILCVGDRILLRKRTAARQLSAFFSAGVGATFGYEPAPDVIRYAIQAPNDINRYTPGCRRGGWVRTRIDPRNQRPRLRSKRPPDQRRDRAGRVRCRRPSPPVAVQIPDSVSNHIDNMSHDIQKNAASMREVQRYSQGRQGQHDDAKQSRQCIHRCGDEHDSWRMRNGRATCRRTTTSAQTPARRCRQSWTEASVVTPRPEQEPYPCDDPVGVDNKRGAFYTGNWDITVPAGFGIVVSPSLPCRTRSARDGMSFHHRSRGRDRRQIEEATSIVATVSDASEGSTASLQPWECRRAPRPAPSKSVEIQFRFSPWWHGPGRTRE